MKNFDASHSFNKEIELERHVYTSVKGMQLWNCMSIYLVTIHRETKKFKLYTLHGNIEFDSLVHSLWFVIGIPKEWFRVNGAHRPRNIWAILRLGTHATGNVNTFLIHSRSLKEIYWNINNSKMFKDLCVTINSRHAKPYTYRPLILRGYMQYYSKAWYGMTWTLYVPKLLGNMD